MATAMQDQIAGWITDALGRGSADAQVVRIQEQVDTETRSLWTRVRALEAAVRAAKEGNGRAVGAVASLCMRIQLIAEVNDLVEVERAARDIARSVKGLSIDVSAGADVALALLVDMASKAARA